MLYYYGMIIEIIKPSYPKMDSTDFLKPCFDHSYLTGIILKSYRDEDEKWRRTLSESQLSGIKPMNCKVSNLSLTGIGLEIPENVKIEEDDHLIIKFTLDNSASTQVEKEAIVKSVINNRIGCEFIDDGNFDPTLGFYFL